MSHPIESRSSLELSADCPHRWDQVYRQGVVDESDAALRGTVFHDAAERYIALLADARVESDYELARQALDAALTRYALPEHLYRDVRHLFLAHAERFELDLGAFLLSEKMQRTKGLKWKPDLVYVRPSVLQITDWKTFYVGYTAAQARDSFQARFYAWAASIIWPGFPVYQIEFVFVRLGYAVAAEFTATDMPEIEEQIQSMRAARDRMIERGRFPARAGSHCAFCSLSTCPIATDARRNPIRVDDPVAVATEITALRGQLAARETALRAYCAANGPVEVNDLVYAHWRTESQRFPLYDAQHILHTAGERLDDVELSKADLKPFLNAKGRKREVAEQLAAIARTTPGWQFRPRKAGSVLPTDPVPAGAAPALRVDDPLFTLTD